MLELFRAALAGNSRHFFDFGKSTIFSLSGDNLTLMRPTQQRMGRTCSRAGCRRLATMTMTYIYSDSTAVLGPLATFAEPHAYDLCQEHSSRMSVPQGWSVIKQEITAENSGPSDDDLMAIANAVRVAGARTSEEVTEPTLINPVGNEIGRRGHLRAIPN